MSFFEKLWGYLNGNKTVFGLFLLQLAMWLPEGTMLWFIPLKDAFQWIGGLLAGTGVLHKMVKSDTSPTPNI